MKSKFNLKYLYILFISALITLHIGCQSTAWSVKDIQSFKKAPIAVIPPIFLQDTIPISDDNELFESNLYIGRIQFSGGFVINERNGSRIQSKNVEFDKQNVYRELSRNSAIDIISTVVHQMQYNMRFIDNKKLPPFKLGELVQISKEEDFTSTDRKDYGSDNVNLPEYNYYLNNIKHSQLPEIHKFIQEKFLLIPIIENYYSNTAGWFNEQNSGCGAGIRMTIQVYIFDLQSGEIVFHYKDSKKQIEPYESLLSEYEIKNKTKQIESEYVKDLIYFLPKK